MWRVLTLLCVSCCTRALPLSVPLGDSVTLACDGTRATGIPEEQLIIRWQTPDRPVLDVSSGKQDPGPDYKGRAEVSREKIRQGNFSLTLHNTKLSDEDYYECYYRGNHDQLQFLNDVRLTVTVRTENRSAVSGGDLSVPVFDDDEVEVLFHNTVVYPKSSDMQNEHVSVQEGYLIIHRVTQADQGIYTVRDRRTKKAVSVITVTVTVKVSDNSDKQNLHHGDKDSDQGDRSTGVTGGVLGAAVVLAAAAGFGIWWCMRRRKWQYGSSLGGHKDEGAPESDPLHTTAPGPSDPSVDTAQHTDPPVLGERSSVSYYTEDRQESRHSGLLEGLIPAQCVCQTPSALSLVLQPSSHREPTQNPGHSVLFN
ncbi:uncharacterized protein [Lepisosteus oculatus]